MKKFLMRTACLILVLLMLVPSIVACKKNTPDGEESSEQSNDVVDTGGESGTSKYDVYDDLGDIDLGGRRVTIAQTGMADYVNEITIERLTGDIVNDAVYKRNANVENRLNIDLQSVSIGNGVYSVLNDLETNILGGTVQYDIVMNPSYTACAYTTRGLFRDLKKIDNIDLEKVYWSPYLNDAYEIGGVQYVASGAISLSFFKFVFITMVNDQILSQTTGEVPDLVQVVKDGKWTIEYQKNLTKNYYSDFGAPGKDSEDIFGFVSTTSIHVDPYVSSGEITFLEKSNDGFYSWAFDFEKASNVMDDVIELFSLESSYRDPTDSMDNVVDMFASSHALMATMRFYELESASIRNMKDEYTVLPIPRYSEDQEGYYSLISDRFTGVVVPASVRDDDVENIGAVLEAMASESYRTVAPAYYETALKVRYVDDASAWEMMDIIIENVKMDAVLPYTAALELPDETRNTVIKLWRWTIYKAYTDGTSIMASTFNENVGIKINDKLNGEDGLQTYIREQLAKQQ